MADVRIDDEFEAPKPDGTLDDILTVIEVMEDTLKAYGELTQSIANKLMDIADRIEKLEKK